MISANEKPETEKAQGEPLAQPKTVMISVFIMGREYKVPFGLTIMKAMEYAGYRFVRGAGCRAGFCGACSTVFRMKDDYKLQTALACQTTVQEGMFLTQIPFMPANKATYDIEDLSPDVNPILHLYPEIARCVSCNMCTRSCPQDLEVMDYIQAALRGDIEETARLSFDCIQCGLCTVRPGNDVQEAGHRRHRLAYPQRASAPTKPTYYEVN